MVDGLLAIGLVVAVLAVIILFAGKEPNPNRKRPKGLAGVLGVFNELYQPSAKNASIIVEEQKKARKQSGSEGKKKPQSK